MSLPGAASFFTAAGLGRVGVAATGLGLVWLVSRTSGSFAAAGTVVGAFAVAEALMGPQVARLVDRHGQTLVLAWVLGAHAGAVGALVVTVLTGAPRPVLVLAGVAAGGSVPQVGALSCARWVALLGERRAWLPRAFALESLANAIAFLVGPVLVSAVAGGGRAWAGTLAALVLVVAGGLALVVQRGTAPHMGLVTGAGAEAVAGTGPGTGSGGSRPDAPTGGAGLLNGRFALLVGLSAVLGLHFGALQLSVAAWAGQHGSAATATVLFAVSSTAGLAGAWAYGLRRWRAAPLVQLGVAAGVLVAGCAVMALATAAGSARPALASVGIGAGLVVAGSVVPVVIVQLSVLVEAQVAREVLTQALAWTSSASAAGSAGAGLLAGSVIDAVGPRGGFALMTGVSTCSLLLALSAQRQLR